MTFRTKQRVDFWLGGCLLLLLLPIARGLGHLLRRDHSLATRRGCVVIKLVGAGSLFLAMPSMQAIRGQFPPGRFFLVGTRAVTGLAASYDWFDACWTIDDSSLPRLLWSSLRVLWQVARHADHLIDLEVHSRLTTLFSLLSMVRNRIGFVDEIVFWRRGFYTHMTWFNTHGPSYAFYDLLAKWFGIEQVPVNDFHAAFRRSVQATPLSQRVKLPRRYVAIGHGCSGFAQERQLLPQEWARVLRPLALLGYDFVFLGAAADTALADAAIATLGCGQNLCGALTLAESTRVIAGAAKFYGVDSLLLHLARALGVEPTSFWGPTDPVTRLRPLTGGERAVFTRMPCAPCVHTHERPPCLGQRSCMAHAVTAFAAGTPNEQQRPTTVDSWRMTHDAPEVTPVSVTYA